MADAGIGPISPYDAWKTGGSFPEDRDDEEPDDSQDKSNAGQ